VDTRESSALQCTEHPATRAGDPFVAAAQAKPRPQMERRFAQASPEPSCAECGVRGLDLHQVPEDHLTFFAGDELCEGCAINHGVL
jgi:hypothetical protein